MITRAAHPLGVATHSLRNLNQKSENEFSLEKHILRSPEFENARFRKWCV